MKSLSREDSEDEVEEKGLEKKVKTPAKLNKSKSAIGGTFVIRDQVLQIKIENTTVDNVNHLLTWIYTGDINMPESIFKVIELCQLSEEY